VDESLSKLTGLECDSRIRAATQIIQNQLQTPAGQAAIEKLFQVCKPMKGANDIATFMSTLMGNFMGVVQYNDEGGNPITIDTLCAGMNTGNASQALANYVAISNLFLKLQQMPCLDASYADSMISVNNLTADPEGVGIRQWTYQTCVAFGYFQTTDSPSQPFGNLVPLSLYTDMCRDGFGFNFGPDIDGTNIIYGGNNPKGATNILFVNGNVDPWHSLSVTHNLTPSVRAILIDGTAHCANMMPPSPKDPPALVDARIKISKQIGEWLVDYKYGMK